MADNCNELEIITKDLTKIANTPINVSYHMYCGYDYDHSNDMLKSFDIAISFEIGGSKFGSNNGLSNGWSWWNGGTCHGKKLVINRGVLNGILERARNLVGGEAKNNNISPKDIGIISKSINDYFQKNKELFHLDLC